MNAGAIRSMLVASAAALVVLTAMWGAVQLTARHAAPQPRPEPAPIVVEAVEHPQESK